MDQILSLTWKQLSFVVHSVHSHKVDTFRTVQEAVILAFGGKVENKKKPKKKSNLSAAEKENAKLMALQSMGIAVGPQK